MTTYIIVGFKVNVENSVFYRKFKSKEELARFIVRNIDKVDFASLRIVKG